MNKGEALRQPCCLNKVTRCAMAPAAAVQATCASFVVPVVIDGGDSDLFARADVVTLPLICYSLKGNTRVYAGVVDSFGTVRALR